MRAGFGRDPVLIPASGGSLPNFVFTGTLGVPSFTVPYAPHDERNHAPNENIAVETFISGIRTTTEFLARFSEQGAQAG